MGIAERKERAAEAMRERILDAAEDMLREGGPGNVSMRGIASRIEYSPAALYSYFPGKENLMQELRQRGFERLCGQEKELPAELAPRQRLEHMCRGYLSFARENAQLYGLMFLPPGQECAEDCKPAVESLEVFARAAWGAYSDTEPTGAELLATGISHWAGLHGLAMILINNNLVFLPPDRRQEMVEQALELMLARRNA